MNILIAMIPMVVLFGIHTEEFPAEWSRSPNQSLSFKSNYYQGFQNVLEIALESVHVADCN